MTKKVVTTKKQKKQRKQADGEFITSDGKPTGKCVLDDVNGDADDKWFEAVKKLMAEGKV